MGGKLAWGEFDLQHYKTLGKNMHNRRAPVGYHEAGTSTPLIMEKCFFLCVQKDSLLADLWGQKNVKIITTVSYVPVYKVLCKH